MLTFLGSSAFSQDGSDYKNAIGLRISGGYYDALAASYKTFLSERGALELNLGIRVYSASTDWVNLSFSAGYQHHFPIGEIPGFKWFIGGGLTAFNSFSDAEDYSGFGLGIFPTGGIDYKFSNIPLNLSADIRPTIMIVEPYEYYDRFYAGNVGISAWYTF